MLKVKSHAFYLLFVNRKFFKKRAINKSPNITWEFYVKNSEKNFNYSHLTDCSLFIISIDIIKLPLKQQDICKTY